MEELFKKLNYKDQPTVLIVNAPIDFLPAQNWLASIASIVNSTEEVESTAFAMLFATKQEELNYWIPRIDAKLEGDAILWCCYPKGSSKRYTCDFNRDTGWQLLGKLGYEGVRQVAIDADWSALRFRRVDFIKTLTRRTTFALTESAKRRTSGQ